MDSSLIRSDRPTSRVPSHQLGGQYRDGWFEARWSRELRRNHGFGSCQIQGGRCRGRRKQ